MSEGKAIRKQQPARDNSRTVSLILSAFKQYYFKYANSIEVPTRIPEREFGYMSIGGSGMTRHLSYKTMGNLLATLVKEVPSDVYCSNAYYRFPTYPMQEKQWLGADLIFDIDGKDLRLPCEPYHTFTKCMQCGQISEPSNSNFRCNNCQQQTKADKISIPCKECIRGSKNEVKKLIALLMEDLGINQKDVSIYFSGNNGFHVHVVSDAFLALDRDARLDIASYLTGSGIMAESIGVRRKLGESDGTSDNFFIKFPKGGISYGWRARMADALKIEVSSAEKLGNIVRKKGGYLSFRTEFEEIAKEKGVKIDPQVTMDIHRVFRMPGTINSKSGLAKVKCTDIDSFNPLVDACLLGEENVVVDVKSPVKLNLKGRNFRIKKGENTLPAYAAVYLTCKGLAEAV